MRKLFKTVLAFTAACLFAGSLHSTAQQKIVRVGLFYASSAVNGSIDISSPTGFTVGHFSDGEFVASAKTDSVSGIVKLMSDGTLNFIPDEPKSVITFLPDSEFQNSPDNQNAVNPLDALMQERSENSSPFRTTDSYTPLVLMPSSDGQSTPYIEISGKKYPEALEFCIDENQKIKIINVVSLEQYIKGVLPNEVYSSWEPDALKAAAVATRTYTLKSIKGKHSSHNFDLCTTTDCQVYAGVTKIADSTNAAVDETFGQVLYYNGVLAETVYHALSGGITESASGAWGGNPASHPYLTIVKTPFENYAGVPNGVWSHTYSYDELYSTVNAKYPSKLSDIYSVEYNTDGGEYIHSMTITDSRGSTVKLNTSSAVRSLFGKYARSANLTLHTTLTPSDEKTDKVYVMTSDGVQSTPVGDGLEYLTASSTQRLHGLSRVWHMQGKGYGHGVGMSQYGAQHAALQGYSYFEILDTYYPGTQLCNMYSQTQNLENGEDFNDN